MKKNIKLILSVLTGLSSFLNAQPGTLDNSFIPQIPAGSVVRVCALQPDGKLLVAGDFTNGIARLNTDGSLDATFLTGAGTNSGVCAIALQPDGKIIIGGTFTSYNGTASSGIARLNTNGSIDNTFNIGAGFTGTVGMSCSIFTPVSVRALAVQSDGKIVAGGCFSQYNGTIKTNLARLNANGTLDNTFTGTGPDGEVRCLALQPDGKLLMGGRFYTYNGAGSSFLMRVNPDGSPDNAFSANISIGPNNIAGVRAITLQPDGKFIICGNFNYCSTAAKKIARLDPNGMVDYTFQLNQINPSIYYSVNATALQANGKVIVGGEATAPTNDTLNRVLRLATTGTQDNIFVSGRGVHDGDVYAVAIQNDSKVIICGDFKAYDGSVRNGVARLNGEPVLGLRAFNSDGLKANVFPNPNTGVFSLQLDQGTQAATLRIVDVLGKEVSGSITPVSNIRVDFDLSDEPEGLYFLLIESDGKKFNSKIVVARPED